MATALPDDYELITIGFKKALNYVFIVENSISSAQIFEYLPGVLAFPFAELDSSDITVKQLVPYSSSDVDYTITVAEVYFKKNLVSALQAQITTSGSSVYENTEASEKSLASLIDSRIPLTGLVDSSSSSSSSSGSGSSGTVAGLGSMDENANTSGKKLTKSTKLVGIIAGSSVAVGAYASIVVAIYWRRKRKQAIEDESDTDEESGPYRDSYSSSGQIKMESEGSSQYIPSISGPMNVKSSLGW